jgi:hypothetical protein
MAGTQGFLYYIYYLVSIFIHVVALSKTHKYIMSIHASDLRASPLAAGAISRYAASVWQAAGCLWASGEQH